MVNKSEIQVGREVISFETGKLAKQANSAVTVQCGGTVVLVTTVMAKEAKPDSDFLPLTVEYKEKTYAAGRIPGGFFKREGRPSEKEILTSRLIDRPIRPLFPDGFYNELQVFAMVLSSDGVNDPDTLAMLGASCALCISDIPFEGPLGVVRIGRINNEFIINPTYDEVQKSSIDLVVAGTRKGINMIESGAKEVSEELMLEAMELAYQHVLKLIDFQEKFAKQFGKSKAEIEFKKISDELYAKVKDLAIGRLTEVYQIGSKEEREEQLDIIVKDIVAALVTEDSPYSTVEVKSALVKVEKEQVRKMILKDKKRVDGRSVTQVRPISAEVNLLPRTHGSAVFTRGQTQSLSVVTLGTSADEQVIDALEGESYKNFMLHYNFPSFSVGEVKPIRGPGRREIGHGALAERGLSAVMPAKEEFPYTVRLVSEILESNGSSSMATVCAGTLSLLDAGVPIKAPVSGVALGLVKEGNDFVVLTDILGLEDHFGDMDFKVTGTKQGVTAIQLDLKIDGIGMDIIRQAVNQAKEGRMFILDKMVQVIDKPRGELSPYAPRIIILKIAQDKIKDLIGPGGKIVKKIIAETGVKIDIEDDGTVAVASNDGEAMKKAIQMIRELTDDVEVNKIYRGKITRIMNFGAFCELSGLKKEGLIHVSELADSFVKNVEDVVKIGDEVTVKVIEIDSMNRVNLSIKKAKDQPAA